MALSEQERRQYQARLKAAREKLDSLDGQEVAHLDVTTGVITRKLLQSTAHRFDGEALVRLLIARGIIDRDDFLQAQVMLAEQEAQRLEDESKEDPRNTSGGR